MPRPGSTAVVLALAALAGACAASGVSVLPQPGSVSDVKPAAQPGTVETSFTVPGTPTGVYTQVARNALSCWFGSDGPLKAAYIFHAAAEPPATGGAAEIVIRERDTTLRDQRGTRVYHVSFESAPVGARVAVAVLKLEPAIAQAMAKDVETWSKGGTGCQLRVVMPPPPPPPVAKGKGSGKAAAKAKQR